MNEDSTGQNIVVDALLFFNSLTAGLTDRQADRQADTQTDK